MSHMKTEIQNELVGEYTTKNENETNQNVFERRRRRRRVN